MAFNAFDPQLKAAESPGGQVSINFDTATAFERAVQAIQSVDGQIRWQSPPKSAKFIIIKKDFWSTGGNAVRYRGDLFVLQSMPQQSAVCVNLKIDWSSTPPLIITYVMLMIVCLLFPLFPWRLMVLIFLLGITYSLWELASKLPNDIANEILARI